MIVKLNLKMCLAAVVIVVTIIVATSVVRPTTYSGLGLNFPVGNGAVTITNASKDSLPVQLVGTGYSIFTLNSKTEGVSGTSVKQTVGTTISQLLEFGQPSGVTTFTVTKGANIKYIAPAETRLQASVQPMTDTDTRNIGFLAIGIILVALYYISAQTEHSFARKLLHRELPIPLVVAPAVVDNTNVGRDGRMYSNYGTND
jgi:hypothetical protein